MSKEDPTETRKERRLDLEIDFLASLHKRLPENVDIIRPLSDLLIRNGRYEQGLSVDQQLVKLRPTDPDAWYQLGCSFAMLGRVDEAIDALENAIDCGYRDVSSMFKDRDLKLLWENLEFLALVGKASMNERIEVLFGDITTLDVDAIVNAANNSLLGGGGVDGAIHRAAGPELLKECVRLNGCKTGDAKVTGGYSLAADFVIHTVGPVWKGGHHNEDRVLANCYQRCLDIARDKGLKSIAFPAISTGAYCYPLERAANIAADTILKNLVSNNDIDRVFFVCFDQQTYDCYVETLKKKI